MTSGINTMSLKNSSSMSVIEIDARCVSVCLSVCVCVCHAAHLSLWYQLNYPMRYFQYKSLVDPCCKIDKEMAVNIDKIWCSLLLNFLLRYWCASCLKYKKFRFLRQCPFLFATKSCVKFFHRTNIMDVRIYYEELNYQYMEQVAQYTASQYGDEIA